MPPQFFYTIAAERAYYDLHQNNPQDAGYRRFLSRLFQPMVARLSPSAEGLDFGSGPGPTLSLMLAEAGFSTAIYDLHYHDDPAVWERDYDFITASEVVEHLHQPRDELERLWRHLKPGGKLGVMTKRRFAAMAFGTWHYKSDPTHVLFFSDATFNWLCEQWSATLELIGSDVVIIAKPL